MLNYITVNDLNDLENLDDWKALLNLLREKYNIVHVVPSATKIYGQNKKKTFSFLSKFTEPQTALENFSFV